MSEPTSKVVLLIPGIFGFNAFGSAKKPLLEYFAGVRQILEAKPWQFQVRVHEPPPTGSLADRAQSLCETLRKLKCGEKLPHAQGPLKTDRVHLVGHSAGGLDARLVANPKFRWNHGPSDAERRALIEMIGQIVTIATPFRGSPVVDDIGLVRDVVVGTAYDLNLLGAFRSDEIDALFLQWIAGSGGILKLLPSSRLHAAVVSRAARWAARKHAPDKEARQVAAQIQRFIGELHHNQKLYADLSVAHMKRVHGAIRDGDPLDRIHSYVTVSPRPPVLDIGSDLVGRLVYAILYRRTARRPFGGPQPSGSKLESSDRIDDLLTSDVSCDGAVPTRSQTLGGHARGIVLADHLDVVGSFEGGTGADVMRSGSHFRQPDFERLWKDVAGCIASEDRPVDRRPGMAAQ